MTFKKKWLSGEIVSSDGYSVKMIDRATLLYTEKQKIYVGAEMLAPKQTWALYPEDMRINSVQGKKLDDEELRELIVHRIREAFDHFGWKLEIS